MATGHPRGGVSKAALIVTLLAIAGIAAVVFWVTGGGRMTRHVILHSIEGAGEIVLRQAVTLADRFLLPELACESVTFDAPGTVRLTGLTLTTEDGFEVARLDSVELLLTQRPRFNTPLAIERISIVGGHLRLHANPSNSTGGLRGLSPLLRARDDDSRAAPETDAVNADADQAPTYRLSDLLTIRLIEISEFDIEYLGTGESEPVRLTDIGASVNLVPVSSGVPSQDGTADADPDAGYAIDLRIEREPAFTLAVSGTLDDAIASFNDVSLAMKLSLEEQDQDTLPPSLRRILDAYQVRGDADVTVSTPALVFDTTASSEFIFGVSIDDAKAVFGDRNLSAQTLRLDARIKDQQLKSANLHALAYDGEITASGEILPGVDMAPGLTAWVWNIVDVDLARALVRPANTDAPPRLAGRLNGEGNLRLAMLDFKDTFAGDGVVRVRNGRFVALPVLTQLADAMSVAAPFTQSVTLNQKLDAEFTHDANGVTLTKSEVTTSVFAARMTGDVGFDGSLNLRANGGPLEKVQSVLGVVGDVLGAVTDLIVTYLISGTASEPTVSVAPLGIGGNSP